MDKFEWHLNLAYFQSIFLFLFTSLMMTCWAWVNARSSQNGWIMNKTSVLYLRGGFKDEMFQNVGKFRITRPFLLMKLPQMFFGIIFVFKWPPDNEYNIFEHSWLSYSTESDSKRCYQLDLLHTMYRTLWNYLNTYNWRVEQKSWVIQSARMQVLQLITNVPWSSFSQTYYMRIVV